MIIPVLVQPDSVQSCLLGTNAFPHLGLKVTRVNGEPLLSSTLSQSQTEVAQVNLVKSVTIPGEKGGYLEARIQGTCDPAMLFEAKQEAFESLGVSVQDSLLSVKEGGVVLIPVQNFQGVSARFNRGMDLGTVVRVCEESICPVSRVAVVNDRDGSVNGHGCQVEVVSGCGSQEEEACGYGCQVEVVSSVGKHGGVVGNSERCDAILSALNLSREGLTDLCLRLCCMSLMMCLPLMIQSLGAQILSNTT